MSVEHQHMIIRAEVNKPLTDPELTKNWLIRIVDAIGMKICKTGGPHVDYVEAEGNCGIAGTVMIETSHISVHCWDQITPKLAQIDIYSCSPYDPDTILWFLQELDPTKVDCVILDRKKSIEVKKTSSWG